MLFTKWMRVCVWLYPFQCAFFISHARVHTHARAHTHTHTHTHTHSHTYTYTHTCLHAHLHTSTHIYMHTHMYAHTYLNHTHTLTLTHTHTDLKPNASPHQSPVAYASGHFEQQAAERQAKVEEARANNELYECNCCYDDECLFEDMNVCSDGHLFCRQCIARSAEAAFGEGTFKCVWLMEEWSHVAQLAECWAHYPALCNPHWNHQVEGIFCPYE